MNFNKQIQVYLIQYFYLKKRNYIKLTDILATLGGFIKALMIVGFIIANPVSKLSLKTELVNRLFNFEGVEQFEEDLKECSEQQNQQIQQSIKQNMQKRSKFCIQDLKDKNKNVSQKETQNEVQQNQIQLKLKINNDNFLQSQNSPKNGNNEGKNQIQTESINNRAIQNLLSSNQNNIQQINMSDIQNQIQFRMKQQSLSPMNSFNLQQQQNRNKYLKNDTSELGLTKIFQNKSFSPSHSLQSSQKYFYLQNQQKDKLKLIRTMLKSYASQRSMKQEDCIKAGSYIGAHKKEDPDSIFKKLFKSNEKTLIMNLWDYFKYFLGLKKEVKNKQIKFSMGKVNERLDIVFILKKLIEVDKLKMLFLNENQRKIFEYLPRPIVRLDPEKQLLQTEFENQTLNQEWARQMILNDKNYISKAVEAMLAYQDIISKRQILDPLDQKLIDMLDESKKLYFQVESPTNSPTSNSQRNNLTVINNINHISQKQKDVFFNDFQNISPVESIELQERDIQEIKVQELNNKNDVNLLYDNTCFNRRNTMHFIKQKINNIGDLNVDKDNQNNTEQPSIPSFSTEKSNLLVQQRNTLQTLNTSTQKYNDLKNNQLQNKILNSQSDSQDENKQNKAIICEYNRENNNQNTNHSNEEQQSEQFIIQTKNIEKNLDSSCQKIPQIKDHSNCQFVTFLKNESQSDISYLKNTVKTPSQRIFNQVFSPLNDSADHFQYQKNSNSDEDIEAFQIPRDKELNNDFDKFPPLADEIVSKQTIKNQQMIPSHDLVENKQSNRNQIKQTSLVKNLIPAQYQDIGIISNQNCRSKINIFQNLKTNDNTQSQNNQIVIQIQ